MITWVRYENHKRYHAILAYSTAEGIVTWCGRQTGTHVTIATNAPTARCRACLSKLEHPYLLPAKHRERAVL